ncbi:MAG: DUF547 domain-containing protein [Verrucomicrobiota bacterium]
MISKSLLILTLISITTLVARGFDHSAYDAVLKKYVDSEGLVDYAGLAKDRTALDAYLVRTGAVPEATFKSWSEAEQLAFLFNVYNAETLQFIIDNYPVESIKKLGGLLSSPWDKKVVSLFGSETTLNKVEHSILRGDDYDEPRLHFALVCAAISCPPLRREAYTAAKLDAQLDDQAKVFLAQSDKNGIKGDTLYLSKIFDWYGADFESGDDDLVDYLTRYWGRGIVGKDVEFTDYNWGLNEQ